jgi:hypothetical protein
MGAAVSIFFGENRPMISSEFAYTGSRRALLKGLLALGTLLPYARASAQAPVPFPGVGHKYLVDFKNLASGAQFRTQLHFTSPTSLTYTGVRKDGSLGGSETVTIRTEQIAGEIFLVTWQEGDKTTVVHIEDFARKTIITNITDGATVAFSQYHGTFVQLS